MLHELALVYAHKGERTDAGTALVMIGAACSAGGLSAAAAGFSPYRKDLGERLKRWARWIGAILMAVGIPLAAIGIAIHRR